MALILRPVSLGTGIVGGGTFVFSSCLRFDNPKNFDPELDLI